ncbi:MAG TPA: hypothetical protein DHV62_08240 [Elusimicrobia bacterium]|jgi:superoxide reductase|nr:hypothetical protein [Elusimicrobiota bacterium]
MEIFVCKKCGFLAFKEAPEICPICGAAKEQFIADPQAIKKPTDPKNLNESEKKHIPVVKIVKQCSLIGPGCTDVFAKVGEITHVMETKHWIMWIDWYLDYRFVSRQYLRPETVFPASMIHLKATSGKITVLENCNLHGRWLSETDLSA